MVHKKFFLCPNRYAELPKYQRPRLVLFADAEASSSSDSSGLSARPGQRQGAILRYFASRHCPACLSLVDASSGGRQGRGSPLCADCAASPQRAVLELSYRVRRWDAARRDLHTLCGQCAGFSTERSNPCRSLDCPVTYRAAEAEKEAAQIDYVQDILHKLTF